MIVPYKLALSDLATINVSLNDGIQYANPRFAPVIAPRQRSPLARGGPYQSVIQPILLDVLGDTPTRCYENLKTLIDYLDQTDRWMNDDAPVNPIYLIYQATALAPTVQAELWGYQGDDTGYDIDDTQELYRGRYAIRDVQLNIVRMGVWEAASTEGTAGVVTATSAVNPGVMTATQPTAPTVPSRYRFGGSRASVGDGFIREGNPAFLLLTNDPNKLLVLDNTTFAGGGTATADAANNPLGGSVRRFTASTTEIGMASNGAAGTGWTTPKRRVGVFAAVRNNSANTSFFLRAEVTDTEGTPNSTRPIEIPPTTTLPQIVSLGVVVGPYDQAPVFTFNIWIKASQTAAPQTFDIDYVAYICLDDTLTDRVIATGTAITAATQEAILTIEPGAFVTAGTLARTSPLVTATSGGFPHGEPYRGDAYLLSTGLSISALLLTTNGDNYWRIGGATAHTLNFTTRRRLAYRTPPGS